MAQRSAATSDPRPNRNARAPRPSPRLLQKLAEDQISGATAPSTKKATPKKQPLESPKPKSCGSGRIGYYAYQARRLLKKEILNKVLYEYGFKVEELQQGEGKEKLDRIEEATTKLLRLARKLPPENSSESDTEQQSETTEPTEEPDNSLSSILHRNAVMEVIEAMELSSKNFGLSLAEVFRESIAKLEQSPAYVRLQKLDQRARARYGMKDDEPDSSSADKDEEASPFPWGRKLKAVPIRGKLQSSHTSTSTASKPKLSTSSSGRPKLKFRST